MLKPYFSISLLLDSGGPNPYDFHADPGSKAPEKITRNNAMFRIWDIPDSASDFFHPGSRVDKIPVPDPHQRI